MGSATPTHPTDVEAALQAISIAAQAINPRNPVLALSQLHDLQLDLERLRAERIKHIRVLVSQLGGRLGADLSRGTILAHWRAELTDAESSVQGRRAEALGWLSVYLGSLSLALVVLPWLWRVLPLLPDP
jgi:hypothetical protein